jgi:hypothetical protein
MGEWIELFDGRSLAGWKGRTARGQDADHRWDVVGHPRLRPDDPRLLLGDPDPSGAAGAAMRNGEDGRTADLCSELEHGDCELHVEFLVGAGSNSGVYLQGQYEVQILDSWGTPESELKYGTCGGIYARWIDETKTPYDGAPPRTNASRRPGEWQSFDIVFRAARFDGSGQKTAHARFERVTHNGVVIHEDFECTGPTRGAWQSEDLPTGPLRLQGDHGPVAFRNLRIQLLD